MQATIRWTAMLLIVMAATVLAGAARVQARAENGTREVEGELTVNAADRTVSVKGQVYEVTDRTEIEIHDKKSNFDGLVTYLARNPRTEGEVEFTERNGRRVALEVEIEDEDDDDDDKDDKDD